MPLIRKYSAQEILEAKKLARKQELESLENKAEVKEVRYSQAVWRCLCQLWLMELWGRP